jgi:hypothetical protein
MTANGYAPSRNWNMSDYKKLDSTHHLSSFQVRLPIWDGPENPRSPFAEWKSGNSLPWYKAYNDVKHSRHVNFDQSNFRNMLDSMCGLVALLGSQFFTIDIGPEAYVSDMSSVPSYEIAIGNYFEIKFPSDWPDSERYSFNWHQLANDPNPFQHLTF